MAKKPVQRKQQSSAVEKRLQQTINKLRNEIQKNKKNARENVAKAVKLEKAKAQKIINEWKKEKANFIKQHGNQIREIKACANKIGTQCAKPVGKSTSVRRKASPKRRKASVTSISSRRRKSAAKKRRPVSRKRRTLKRAA